MESIQIKDLFNYSFYGNLKSEGDSAVFARALVDEEKDDYSTDLMLYKDGAIRQLTSRGSVSEFIFKGDNEIWFVQPSAEKDKKGTILYSMKLDGGEAVKEDFVEKSGIRLIQWLPGDVILTLVSEPVNEKEDPALPDYEVIDERPWYFNGAGFINKKRTRAYLYFPQDSHLSLISGNLSVSNICVCGSRVFVTGGYPDPRNIDAKEGLYEIFLNGEEPRQLVEEKYMMYSLDALDGKLMVFASDGSKIGLNSNPELYVYDPENETFEMAYDWCDALGNTVGTDCAVLEGNTVQVHNDALFFTGTIVNHVNLFCWKNGNVHQVLEWPGTIHSYTIMDDHLLFLGARPNEMQELYEADKNGQVKCLSHFQDSMKDKYTAQVQPVFYNGWQDKEQLGWVLYPKDFDPNKKYPGVLDIHGGPKTVYGTIFYHEMQVWASHGYFVFFCNPYGSDGQGNEYADMRGRYGSQDFDDLMSFTDAVLEQIPQIDPERIGVTGGSYGGFMTNWIVGHTSRFKAAATQRSISNWISFYGTSDIGPCFVEDQQGSGLEDIENLWNHSPLKYKDNITTPTLVIHSDEDYRCPLEQGYQMFNACQDAGVDSRMVMFRKENHELSRSGKPSHRIRRLEEITNWMDKHLKEEGEDNAR